MLPILEGCSEEGVGEADEFEMPVRRLVLQYIDMKLYENVIIY